MRTRRPRPLTAALVGVVLIAGCAGDDVDGDVDAELEELDDDSGDGDPIDADADDADEDVEDEAEADAADGGDGLQVTIRDNSFNPGALDVAVGDTVTWTHDGSLGHNVTADEFSSGALSGGDTFEFTFEEAGTFAYACTIHRGMAGEISVS